MVFSIVLGAIFSMYVLVSLLGIVGNSVVIVIIVFNRRMHTVTNLFILNLAVSDILMSSVATPFTPVAMNLSNWPLSNVLCKLFPLAMGVSVYVSTLTCTAISINRFYVITRPCLAKLETWLCVTLIVSIWGISLLISLPLGVYQEKSPVNGTNESFCMEKWPHEASREIFTIVNFVLQFVVPGSIISACYWKISTCLRRQCLINSITNRKTQHDLARKRRTNSMLMAMIFIFVICWIPLNIFWMASDLVLSPSAAAAAAAAVGHGSSAASNSASYASGDSTDNYLVFYFCHLIAMSSAVYNPFLYVYMNENFQRGFKQLCLFWPCRKRQTAPNCVQIKEGRCCCDGGGRMKGCGCGGGGGGGGAGCAGMWDAHRMHQHGSSRRRGAEAAAAKGGRDGSGDGVGTNLLMKEFCFLDSAANTTVQQSNGKATSSDISDPSDHLFGQPPATPPMMTQMMMMEMTGLQPTSTSLDAPSDQPDDSSTMFADKDNDEEEEK